jgi:coenzyme F420 hydrogenase subunit beta
MRFRNVQEIAQWRLCLGCGTCAALCPENKIKLVNIIGDGIRPNIVNNNCGSCRECVNVCPGYEQVKSSDNASFDVIGKLTLGWGKIFEVWEGHATDADIRRRCSSGGVATALAAYCIEKGGMSGVIHTGADAHNPLSTSTLKSKTVEELCAGAGSRYTPASPCEGLKYIENDPGQWAFIGKPCDAAGVRKGEAAAIRPVNNIGVVISIFCAGTPSTKGTRDLLKAMVIDPDQVASIRYRGDGWPGKFSVTMKGVDDARKELTYSEAWGGLQKYRPYRCHLCQDGTGEYADIACGDPWYREIKQDEEGYSLILVRTRKGHDILHDAIVKGYISAELMDASILEKSQTNLLNKRAAVWGRLLAFRLFGLPVPTYVGFPLFRNWMTLSVSEKIRSVAGTVRRIMKRRYWRPEKIVD